MKEKVSICYVDDDIDTLLSKYLFNFRNKYNNEMEDSELETEEYQFTDKDDYKTLLKNDLINNANILLIDSRLFETGNTVEKKFTGEKFKIILQQILPFIKTIVITQNEILSDSVSVSKFKDSGFIRQTADDYYDENLKQHLNRCIKDILEGKRILKELTDDNEIDPLLISNIEKTISGIEETAIFEKEELDELICLFKEVKKNYDE